MLGLNFGPVTPRTPGSPGAPDTPPRTPRTPGTPRTPIVQNQPPVDQLESPRTPVGQIFQPGQLALEDNLFNAQGPDNYYRAPERIVRGQHETPNTTPGGNNILDGRPDWAGDAIRSFSNDSGSRRIILPHPANDPDGDLAPVNLFAAGLFND